MAVKCTGVTLLFSTKTRCTATTIKSYSSHNASEHAEQLYTASTVTGTGQHDIRPPAQLHAAAAVTGEYSHHHFTSTITVGGTAYNSVHGLFLTHAPRRAAL